VGSLAPISEAKIGRSGVVLTLLPPCANDEPNKPAKENQNKQFIFISFFPYSYIFFLVFSFLLSGYLNNE